MKHCRGLSQVGRLPRDKRLFKLFGWMILWGTLSLLAEARPAILDRASSLFPTSLEQSNPWISYQSIRNTDFNSYHPFDQASIKFAKNGYEIDVRLHANPENRAKIFWPSSERVGLGLISCDVDQDGDQDLVLTSPLSLFPLAIWLSDGAGHFQEGDKTYFAPLFSNDRHPTFHPGKKLDRQIWFPRQRKALVGLLTSAHGAARLKVSTLGISPSPAPLPLRGALFLTSRSPPKSLSF